MKNTYFLDKDKTQKLVLHQGFNFKVNKVFYNDKELVFEGNSLKNEGIRVKLDNENSLKIYWDKSPYNPMQKMVNFELNQENINIIVYADLEQQQAQGVLAFVGGITIAAALIQYSSSEFLQGGDSLYTFIMGAVFLGLYFWSKKDLKNKLPYIIGFILYLLDSILWLLFILPQTFSDSPNIFPIIMKGVILFMLYKGAFQKEKK